MTVNAMHTGTDRLTSLYNTHRRAHSDSDGDGDGDSDGDGEPASDLHGADIHDTVCTTAEPCRKRKREDAQVAIRYSLLPFL
jgi:hypothetical protein